MRKLIVLAILLSCVVSAQAFGQSTYATVSGTVSDKSGAVLPGVSMTATNNATGVVTTVLSNETGAYNIASLLPGAYTVSAALTGFQKATFTNVTLGNAQQVRLNFTMQVTTQSQQVEVSVAADTAIATSSASIGEVLSQQKVSDLPIVGNNILSFLTLMPGVRMNDDGVTGTFAGLSADKINVQRDGVDASASARYVQAGAQTATFVAPDLVGEVRVIIAPVDAELGRGNGQVQFLTRSGTNQFHGAGVWFVRNTALDANTWTNNRQVDSKTGAWKPTTPDWANLHQLTGSIGGPIVKEQDILLCVVRSIHRRSPHHAKSRRAHAVRAQWNFPVLRWMEQRQRYRADNFGRDADNSRGGFPRQSSNSSDDPHRRRVHGRPSLCERVRRCDEHSDAAGLL